MIMVMMVMMMVMVPTLTMTKVKQDKQPSCKGQDTVSSILMVNIMVAVVVMKRRKQAGHDEKMLKMTNR